MPPREFINNDISEIERKRDFLSEDQIEYIVERVLEKLLPVIKDFMNDELSKIKIDTFQLNEKKEEETKNIEFLEVKKRSWKLVFVGIPDASPEMSEREQDLQLDRGETVDVVVKCCKEILDLEIKPHDIVSCQRMNKGRDMQHRPIMVGFASQKVRDGILNARKHLKSTNIGIYINELLTKKNANIYYECRQLVKQKKLSCTWTSNGFVFVKKTRWHNEKPLKIVSLEDLEKL